MPGTYPWCTRSWRDTRIITQRVYSSLLSGEKRMIHGCCELRCTINQCKCKHRPSKCERVKKVGKSESFLATVKWCHFLTGCVNILPQAFRDSWVAVYVWAVVRVNVSQSRMLLISKQYKLFWAIHEEQVKKLPGKKLPKIYFKKWIYHVPFNNVFSKLNWQK